MEEGEQEKRGEEEVKQNGAAEVTGGQNGDEKLGIYSPKEGDGTQVLNQDEARKSSVEQEMERCILSSDSSQCNEKPCFSRYLRSELSKQEQSSSEVVRSLLGKSPKKEEKQILQEAEVNNEERQILEPVVTKPASEQTDIKLKMVEPVVKEGNGICEAQSAKIEEKNEGEIMPKHVSARTGSPSNGSSLNSGAASNTTCNGGSLPTVGGAIPRIEVIEAGLPSQVEASAPSREPVVNSSSNGLPKHIASPPTSSSTSSPAAPSPSRIPSRQQQPTSTQHQQSSPNSSQGHSPVGLQGAFDLKAGVSGQVGGQEELRKLESRIERFVSRSSGSECR